MPIRGQSQQLFTPGLVSLAPRFKEADAGGDGNIEALDRAGHGNAHELVASLTSETAQSGAFETHGDGERAGQVGVVECPLGLVGGADDSDAIA